MAIVKKGSRRIVIDGVAYLWTVRPKPTYCQANAWGGLSFAAQLEEGGQSILAADLELARPDNWHDSPSVVVTPALVERAVRQALANGWRPMERGAPYILSLPAVR